MTPEEVKELLSATLHGPLPQKTVYRMMATLGEWMDLPAKVADLEDQLARMKGARNQEMDQRREVLRTLADCQERCGSDGPEYCRTTCKPEPTQEENGDGS
jgi:hypothetical protein